IDPCQIDSCGDDWKPVETITDENFEILDKDNNTYNWTEKKLGTDGKIQTIPHSETVENGCEWKRDTSYIRMGVTYLLSEIPMPDTNTNPRFRILDDADFSVCKGKSGYPKPKDVWRGKFTNVRLPVFMSLCETPKYKANFNGAETELECFDIGSGNESDFTNLLNYVNTKLYVPNGSTINICEWVKDIYITLQSYQRGPYSQGGSINMLAPLHSSLGTMVHESNHLVEMQKLIIDGLNDIDESLAELDYEEGQCPKDVYEKLKQQMLKDLRKMLDNRSDIISFYGNNAVGVPKVEEWADKAEGKIYEIIINEFKKYSKKIGCGEL
ncbi:MAG: hypothetical protein GXX85_02395, partial [Ignavibacteria bacterium]|nr:hypothetical protein [Ignavibacteria bacterium]